MIGVVDFKVVPINERTLLVDAEVETACRQLVESLSWHMSSRNEPIVRLANLDVLIFTEDVHS